MLRAAMRRTWERGALVIGVFFFAACERGSTASVPLESWCVQLESALRERGVACGCSGEPLTDEAIVARCEAFDAASLDAALGSGEVLWNGTIANAILGSLDDCDRAEPSDDPVIGNVALGARCRVFDDVAGTPDDCVFGAVCRAVSGELRCIARDAQCTSAAECPGGTCEAGACVTPVCAGSGG